MNSEQLPFSFFTPVVTRRTATGWHVEPGKPIAEMTPEQLAAEFRVSADSVYRWLDSGRIPAELARRGGLRKWLILAEAIPYLRANFDRRATGLPWLPLEVWRAQQSRASGGARAPTPAPSRAPREG